MDEQAQQDTRNMVHVLIEQLQGADRICIETKNALGCMDTSYLHAPSVLEALSKMDG